MGIPEQRLRQLEKAKSPEFVQDPSFREPVLVCSECSAVAQTSVNGKGIIGMFVVLIQKEPSFRLMCGKCQRINQHLAKAVETIENYRKRQKNNFYKGIKI